MHVLFKFVIVLCTVAGALIMLGYINAQLPSESSRPSTLPTYEQAVPQGFSASAPTRVLDPRDAGRIMQPSQQLQEVSDRIVASCETQNDECYTRAIVTWTRRYIEHTEVIQVRDHVLTPEETLLFRQGDDLALGVLVSALLRAQDIPARIGMTPYSSFVELTLKEEPVRVDMGCVNCGLGRIRYSGGPERITWIE